MEEVMKEKWIYSKREDLYWEYSEEFDTKEKAIESAKDDEEIDGYVFVGKKIPVKAQDIDVDNLLENVAINTTDGFDDYADGFLENVSKEHFDELEEKLNNVFFEWMNKHNYNPDWFKVVDIEEIEL
jgi:hypothetical protein